MTMPGPLALGWRAAPGIAFLRDGPTGVRVGPGPLPPLALQPPTAALADMLAAIADGVAEVDLPGRLDANEQARFHHYVGRLVAHGTVSMDVLHQGDRLATLVPRQRGFELPSSSCTGVPARPPCSP